MLGKTKAICIVCDMLVSRKTRFTAKFKGRKYYFCCEDCRSTFVNNPFEYVGL